MLDGLWIGLGIAAAGWLIARRIPQAQARSERVVVSVPEVRRLARAIEYAAKSARGAIHPPKPVPPAPDPREQAMEAWLMRQPSTMDARLREELQIAWRYAVGIEEGTAADKTDAVATLKLHGAPLPADVDAVRR